MIVPLLLVRFGGNALIEANTRIRFSVRPVLIYLTAYFLFGAGYIAYMTFMIAYVRDGGGGATSQCDLLEPDRRQRLCDTMGVAARACARSRRAGDDDYSRHQRARRGAADLRPCTAVACVSALVFGVAFFAVVGSPPRSCG